MLAREIDIATNVFASLLHRVDVAELYQYESVGTETIFLHEEGYEDAINVEDEIIGINTVKHIVIDLHRQLALHSVGLAHTSYLIYLLATYHTAIINCLLCGYELRGRSVGLRCSRSHGQSVRYCRYGWCHRHSWRR